MLSSWHLKKILLLKVSQKYLHVCAHAVHILRPLNCAQVINIKLTFAIASIVWNTKLLDSNHNSDRVVEPDLRAAAYNMDCHYSPRVVIMLLSSNSLGRRVRNRELTINHNIPTGTRNTQHAYYTGVCSTQLFIEPYS